MKRICLLLVTLALCASPTLRAQDAATEERLNKLSGKVEDLIAAQEVARKQITDLARELNSLREQSAKPSTTYARPEDLNSLAEKVREVDRKRMEDAERTHAELLRLRRVLEAPISTPRKSTSIKSPKDSTATSPVPATSDGGFEYIIKPGDTLDAIVQAYKEKNIKVTVNQIVNANPGLKPERMRVGQKIFIPAP
ncbi:MAG TPA: LysM peptidoglycan-binding domain-containing protein [Candidatus Paceibacterota bacterium]|nr:LysM peptidoglycan-binding domain-containing protein [Verrucomicrobiota bacterium]HSA10708.1 LysM peptidoglycan-binding domain-containing protein [Candidatus Paceibacterota bacterium]